MTEKYYSSAKPKAVQQKLPILDKIPDTLPDKRYTNDGIGAKR